MKISTFKSYKEYERAIDNGYIAYNGEDLKTGGYNYTEVATKLKEQGYKVRVYEETTNVRGLHKYTILYK